MDWERVRITANIYGVKARARLRLLLQIAGIGLVFLGAYNLLIASAAGFEVFAPYRIGIVAGGGEGNAIFFFSDVVVMAVGAAITWWT
jgi:hypothetical protein